MTEDSNFPKHPNQQQIKKNSRWYDSTKYTQFSSSSAQLLLSHEEPHLVASITEDDDDPQHVVPPSHASSNWNVAGPNQIKMNRTRDTTSTTLPLNNKQVYFELYKNMVQQQEQEHESTLNYLKFCFQGIEQMIQSAKRQPNHNNDDPSAENFSFWQNTVSFSDLHWACEQLKNLAFDHDLYCLITDRQLIMILSTVMERKQDQVITWAELAQCYKTCITGMQTLQLLPDLNRPVARHRTLASLQLFDSKSLQVLARKNNQAFDPNSLHRQQQRTNLGLWMLIWIGFGMWIQPKLHWPEFLAPNRIASNSSQVQEITQPQPLCYPPDPIATPSTHNETIPQDSIAISTTRNETISRDSIAISTTHNETISQDSIATPVTPTEPISQDSITTISLHQNVTPTTTTASTISRKVPDSRPPRWDVLGPLLIQTMITGPAIILLAENFWTGALVGLASWAVHAMTKSWHHHHRQQHAFF